MGILEMGIGVRINMWKNRWGFCILRKCFLGLIAILMRLNLKLVILGKKIRK
jgi:hypothetical protein